jgi:hypothetical protein
MFSGPVQPFQQQQAAFAPMQQQQVYAGQQGAYVPQAVPASAPGAGFGGAQQGRTGRVKHHIFHRPVVHNADGRIV